MNAKSIIFTLVGFGLIIAAVVAGATAFDSVGHTVFNLAQVQTDINSRPDWAGPDWEWTSLQADYNSRAVIVWTLAALAVASFIIAFAVRDKPRADQSPQLAHAQQS